MDSNKRRSNRVIKYSAPLVVAYGANKLYKANKNRLQRNYQIAKLGVKSGSRFGLYKAKKRFASVQRSIELEQEFQIKTSQEVTEYLGNMKGAMMKLGQMVSYLDTGLNESAKQVLSSLQKDAPPMSEELASEQIVLHLGDEPENIFAHWDPQPIAAASIGQVHRAITKEDEAVAVKIQYPEVDQALKSDLKKADWVFKGLSNIFPGLDSETVMDEIKSRLIEELDYKKEAANQSAFHEFYKGHPYIYIPKVIDKYSTNKVLTTELIVGSDFNEVLTWPQEEKNKIAETIFRFTFGSIYSNHCFNGDPHPGNYIFHKNGRVTFLDFGLVKKFNSVEVQYFEDLILNMVIKKDKAGFRKLIESVGILKQGEHKFSDEEIYDYFEYFYEYILEDKVVTIDSDYAERGMKQLFDLNSEHSELMKQLSVPPVLVVLQRITVGLMGILAQLDASANWRAISEEIWPFSQNVPSTQMGEQIAKWNNKKK